MPLRDHFRPPLSRQRHWESLHSAWANAICRSLNEDLLPDRYFAEVQVHLGRVAEVDVAGFEDRAEPESEAHVGVGVATWAPPRPTVSAPLGVSSPDLFEVQVWSDRAGPRLVAAVELVSPANKDRPAQRRAFAVKCGSLLFGGVGLIVADVVTEGPESLHDAILDTLGLPPGPPASALFAGAYRTESVEDSVRLDAWVEPLALGAALPALPLWIAPDLCLPIDLEQTYSAACASLRIG